MSDLPEAVEPEDDDEENINLDDIIDQYLNQIEESIQSFLGLLGELGDDVILTDWAVVCTTQGWEDGRPLNMPTHVFPKRYLPAHRVKGLLVDSLDQLKLTESTVEIATIMTVLGRDNDDE